MTDDPKRPRRAMSQTERDLQGLARLRAERARQAQRGDESGEVEAEMGEVDTGMTERISEDPDLSRLFEKVEKVRRSTTRDIIGARREAADLVLEAAGERPPAERFAVVEKRLRFAYWILSAILIPVIMSLVLAAKYVYTRGGRDAKMEIQNTQMIEDIAELKRQNIEQGRQLTDAIELGRRNSQRVDDLLRRRSPEAPAPARSPRPRRPARAVTPPPVSPNPNSP